MLPRLVIFGMIVFSGVTVFSQEKPNRLTSLLYLETKVHYAYLIPHHNEIWALTDGFFPVWEFSLLRQTDGRNHYHYSRRYPQLGLTYLYSNFGGSEYLGEMHALLPNIRLPMVSGKKISMAFGIGLGMAYLTKKFDRLENYKNLTIGSNYNAAVQFQLKLRWQLSPRFFFNTGASMLHVSNGTIKTPNFGLNLPALFGGFEWKLNHQEIDYQIFDSLKSHKRKMNFRLIASYANKQISREWDKEFNVYVASMILSRFYNNADRILLGVDAVYDESTKYVLDKKGQATEAWPDVTKIGVNIGHEWTFSQLSIYINLGYYVHSNNEGEALLYNKLGLTLQFLKYAFVGLNLQTHWGQADFLSFGLGLNL